MANVNDSLLDEIFSVVHLPPVKYDDPKYHPEPAPLASEAMSTPTSEDEHAAIGQLDAILRQQRSSSNSVAESDHIEVTKKDDSSSSSTLKSPQTSRTSTVLGSAYHEPQEPAWLDESNNHFDQARLPGLRRVHDEARIRSQTIDSQASLAESRFGGFDLYDDQDRPHGDEINLHHNEVAYSRPPPMKQAVPQKQRPSSLNQGIFEGSIVDKQILDERRRQILESQNRAKALQDEVLKTQSMILGKELSLRQAAEQARRQIKELEASPKQHLSYEPFHLPRAKVNGHETSYLPHSAPHNQDAPWKYNFGSVKRQPSVDIYEESVPISIVLADQLAHAELIEVCPTFRYFKPQHEKIQLTKNIEKVILGGHQDATNDDKSVLLFGPKSSGKTAFVNSIANYLYDVKKEQDVRFCVNEEKDGEATKGIYVYVFNNTIYPYRITIIDTPGVPNKKGYTDTSNLIRQWFEMELATSNHLRIDAISIVLRHNEDELGWPLINELAAVKRLLKDDLRTNVMPITTFGEVLPQPQALRSIVFANIPFVSYYKVNNAGYMERPQDEKPLNHNMCYKHTVAELERYFTDLHEIVAPLLAVRNRE